MTDENTAIHAPTSVAAWKESNTVTVMFNDELGFEVKHIDITSWLASKKGNALMTLMQGQMNSGNDKKMPDGDAGNILEMMKSIDELLVEIVISPPLTEQGNSPEESVSLANVLPAFKMKIMGELTGGDQYQRMANFRGGQTSNVVAAPEGKDL